MTKRRAEDIGRELDRLSKRQKLEDTKKYCLINLPDELIVQILIRVPLYNLERSSIVSVCSRFATLTSKREFWRSLCVYHWGENIAPNILLRSPNTFDHEAFIIPREEGSERPDWRKYCLYRHHFAVLLDELQRLEAGGDYSELAGYRQAGGKPYRWANCASNELQKNLVHKIIASETSEVYSCESSIVFFGDMLEQCLSQPETVSLTSVTIFLSDKSFRQKQSTFGLFKRVLSIWEKFHGSMLHIVGFPPLRIASRAYRALVLEREYHRMSKDICVDFLVRLVQDWIQHLSEGPTLTAEHKISWNYAKLNIMHTGDYIDYSISHELNDMIMNIVSSEYYNNEANWKRKFAAIAAADLLWMKSPLWTKQRLMIALDAVKQPQSTLQAKGALLLSSTLLDLNTAQPGRNVAIQIITALLDGMAIFSASLFEGLTAIIDYCNKNNFENSVSDELLDKINLTVFKVIDVNHSVSLFDVENLFNVIMECFKERAEPYMADYHLISTELSSGFLCDPDYERE
jgi:hypothetical protein